VRDEAEGNGDDGANEREDLDEELEMTHRTCSRRPRGTGPAVLALLFAAGACAGDAPEAADQNSPEAAGQEGAAPVAFTDVAVLPMDREEVLQNQTVVVRNGVIEAVGPSGEVPVPEDATRIEGSGRWLMPGLAEMHAHVPPVPRGSDEWPDRETLEDILFLYVANGITTIRGMLGATYQLELARMLRDDELLGPSFYVGAPSLNGNTAPTPEAAEGLLREHHAAGYHFQKIHPGLSRETWDHMDRVADELGFTYAGHVPAEVGLFRALETGISTVDHLDGYVEAIVADEVRARAEEGEDVGMAEMVRNLDFSRIPRVVERTREAGTWMVPTMYLWESLIGDPDVEAKLSQPEMRYVSREQREGWRSQAEGRDPVPDEISGPWHEARRRILKALADGGVGVLMGTDSPQMFNVPGFALHREIEVMEEAGMTRFQILESGTRNVGRYVEEELGLDGHFGTVAPGQRADLVLLEENPLDDLEHLERRVGVMVRGRWVPASEIEEGLQELARKHGG